MSRGLAVALGVAAGCLVGMQAPINARLGKTVGSIQAATFSFLVGTVALVAIAAFVNGGLGALTNVGRAPWWALVGGLLGAVYVTVALIAVRTLGASGLTAVVITGQASACSGSPASTSMSRALSGSCCWWPASCSWCAGSESRGGVAQPSAVLKPSRQLE
jgi:transporter family-2 protein